MNEPIKATVRRRTQGRRNAAPSRGSKPPASPNSPPVRKGIAEAFSSSYFFSQTEWWPLARLTQFQDQYLKRLASHALAQVPYYRNRRERFEPLVNGIAGLPEIPILARADVQSAGKSLIADAYPAEHGGTSTAKTSGSSGQPIVVTTTRHASLLNMATTLRGHTWHRRDLALKNLRMRALPKDKERTRPQPWITSPRLGTTLTVNISLPIARLFDIVLEEQPAYLETHPYTLRGMIERSMALGIHPKGLREVRTFGEIVEPDTRALCKNAWGVSVVDNYSATEIGTLAIQCPESESLHVQSELLILEVLNDDGSPCQSGETGRVVVTPLHNFASPLIRYELGDLAEVGGPCVCGRSLPTLTRVVGRERNLLVLPNGEKVFPDFRLGQESALTDLPIRQYQVIQKKPDELELKLAVSSPLSPDQEKTLCGYFDRIFGYAFKYQIQYVASIPRAASGKYEVVKSELA